MVYCEVKLTTLFRLVAALACSQNVSLRHVPCDFDCGAVQRMTTVVYVASVLSAASGAGQPPREPSCLCACLSKQQLQQHYRRICRWLDFWAVEAT